MALRDHAIVARTAAVEIRGGGMAPGIGFFSQLRQSRLEASISSLIDARKNPAVGAYRMYSLAQKSAAAQLHDRNV